MHDLVIRNALIVNGSGALPYHGSLAVDGGLISAIDKSEELGAARQTSMPTASRLPPESSTAIPITTPRSPGTRNCRHHLPTGLLPRSWATAVSPFPVQPEDRSLAMRNLTRVEGISLKAMREGIQWDFQTFPEYLDMLERRGVMPNVAAFLGHSSLRLWVMGPGSNRRAATPGEVEEMRKLVVEAMRAGAIGFATSTAEQHNGYQGYPMPSRLADEYELRTLVAAMGSSERGVFMLTKGEKTRIAFLEEIAAVSGRPVMIAALLHNPMAPEAIFADLAEINQARSRGRELYGQVSCCPLTFKFSMQSPYPFEGLDAWKPALRAETPEALKAVLLDPEFRRAVRAEVETPRAVRLFNGEWRKLSVTQVANPGNALCEGRDIAELAARDGQYPLDWMLDLACAENLETQFNAILLNSDEEYVARALTDPNASIALSDAGAHQTFFCDAGFGLHLLGHWSRELGALSLGQAIYHLSGRPAAIYRIPKRGRLTVGYHADLLLFDPATVNRTPSWRVHDLPGGAPRLITDAIGVHGVWVNGERIVDGKGIIGDAGKPGKLLRRFLS
ncbi:MAG: amidohydrolase family protein [Gammaproteobacteria bacterium]